MGFEIIKEFILDLIFPRECLGCGREGSYLCKNCFAKIEVNKHLRCALCKKSNALGLICPDCQKESNLKAIWVSADYNNKLLQDLIHYLKYKYVEALSEILTELLARFLAENKIFDYFGLNSENTFLVPVPLHKKRELLRGFNQSELIAQKLADHYHFKKINLLKRNKDTISQINLKRTERQKNIKGAFSSSSPENFNKNKKIILIDDVVTTGSTLNECAKELAKSGFSDIYSLVIAQRED
ncbi:MAG: ComF family protein [Candidatus Parcubacteria bacterium]|nr:ComF family protein [Candidatus Parcubacteria bacterium]